MGTNRTGFDGEIVTLKNKVIEPAPQQTLADVTPAAKAMGTLSDIIAGKAQAPTILSTETVKTISMAETAKSAETQIVDLVGGDDDFAAMMATTDLALKKAEENKKKAVVSGTLMADDADIIAIALGESQDKVDQRANDNLSGLQFVPEALKEMKGILSEYKADLGAITEVHEELMNRNDMIEMRRPATVKKPEIEITEKKGRFKDVKTPSGNIERLKRRNKKGFASAGYLFSSNLMVEIYSMDAPLKKQALAESYEYYRATTFHNINILKGIFEHTSVVCADSEDVSFSKGLKALHMEDLDMYLGLTLIASNEGGVLKNFPVMCNSKEEGACRKKQWLTNVDMRKVIQNSLTDEFIRRRSKYDRTKTLEQLMTEAKTDAVKTVMYRDEEKGDTIKATISSPSFEKYFTLTEGMKDFMITEMLSQDNISAFCENGIDKFNYRTKDEKMSILHENFELDYFKILIRVLQFYHLDKIEIFPNEFLDNPNAKLEDYKDDIITIEVKEDSIEDMYHAMIEIPEAMRDEISEIIDKWSDIKQGSLVFTYVCPDCSKVTDLELNVYDLFFMWANNETGK